MGAAIEVHRELGPGALEIPIEAQETLQILYKGHRLQKEYVPDLVCCQKIIVELKALAQLSGIEEAQALNYLKATKFRVALLFTFGSYGKLQWNRLVL